MPIKAKHTKYNKDIIEYDYGDFFKAAKARETHELIPKNYVFLFFDIDGELNIVKEFIPIFKEYLNKLFNTKLILAISQSNRMNKGSYHIITNILFPNNYSINDFVKCFITKKNITRIIENIRINKVEMKNHISNVEKLNNKYLDLIDTQIYSSRSDAIKSLRTLYSPKDDGKYPFKISKYSDTTYERDFIITYLPSRYYNGSTIILCEIDSIDKEISKDDKTMIEYTSDEKKEMVKKLEYILNKIPSELADKYDTQTKVIYGSFNSIGHEAFDVVDEWYRKTNNYSKNPNYVSSVFDKCIERKGYNIKSIENLTKRNIFDEFFL